MLFALLSACDFQSEVKFDTDWQVYKSKFVTAEGRIIDTGNNDVSHSEGQGYGLLLALRANDKESFKQIWHWTKANLQVRNDTLFIWRRRAGTALNAEDQNNATDGDIIIAWALLEAAKAWQDNGYKLAGTAILSDIKKLIIQKDDLTLILPGAIGFQFPDHTLINLSYWVYPAFSFFASVDNDAVWKKLIESGQTLTKKARFGRWQLPPDWLAINNDHSLAPAKTKRFGFDAVRVPLYLLLEGNRNEALLSPFANYWTSYQGYTPSWIALDDKAMDAYGASAGMNAVKQVTLFASKRTRSVDFKTLDTGQDYYSATLFLLSKLSYQKVAS